jgi:hypothetical protein
LRFYWDSSAIINALVSEKVWNRLQKDEHFTRTHSFSEFFAIMTGRGIEIPGEHGGSSRAVMSATDAAAWLRKFAGKINVVELDLPAMLDGLDNASAKGVMGGRVYDYGHLMAAEKTSSESLLTRNPGDFTSLKPKPKIEWP